MIEFRPLPNSRYSVSNTGQIRNDLTGRILKQTKNKYGYWKLHLSLNGKMQQVRVHRIVLSAWKPIENEHLYHCNHKNYDRSDNRIENLEWLSQADNNRHKDLRLHAGKTACRKLFKHLLEKHGGDVMLKKLCEMAF